VVNCNSFSVLPLSNFASAAPVEFVPLRSASQTNGTIFSRDFGQPPTLVSAPFYRHPFIADERVSFETCPSLWCVGIICGPKSFQPQFMDQIEFRGADRETIAQALGKGFPAGRV
jgi:hypothetical protein